MWSFPHTIPQAKVILCMSRGHNRSSTIARISGVSVRQVQRTLEEIAAEGYAVSTRVWSMEGADCAWEYRRTELWEMFLVPRAVAVISQQLHRYTTPEARMRAFCMVIE